MQNNALVPSFTAFAVCSLLENYFPDLVDLHFTAKMEATLDRISTGDVEWIPYLREFYSGDKGLDTQVRQQEDQIEPTEAKTIVLENLPVNVRIGKFGPYLETEKDGETITASIPQNLTPSDLDSEQVEVLLRQKTEGPDKLGMHPETGEPIYILIGSYGPYVQLGEVSDENPKPKRASLPKGQTPETITLETAVGLFVPPPTVGRPSRKRQ